MYHHQNQNSDARQGRAFGNTLDGNTSNKPNPDAGKNGTGTTFEKRQTRSMTKRNASKQRQLQPQPRPNANGNSNGAGVAVQRPFTTSSTAMIASTNPFIAPTSRPTAFSSISNLGSYQHTGNVDDIDARDKDDPLCATDYVQAMVSTCNANSSGLRSFLSFSNLTNRAPPLLYSTITFVARRRSPLSGQSTWKISPTSTSACVPSSWTG